MLITKNDVIVELLCNIENALAQAKEAEEKLRELLENEQTGHWIPQGDSNYKCSKCGVQWVFPEGSPEDNGAYYCPMCGSYNGGGRK